MHGILAGAIIFFSAAEQCQAQDKYQEGYKCYQQEVTVSKGGCQGVVKGSSCADTTRASEMQAEIGKIWFEGKSPEYCKEYFTSVCKGVGGTAKEVPEDCSFACGFPGCRRDEDCTDRYYKPVYCCESHRDKFVSNCNAVNTATLDAILSEMKVKKECSDTDCIMVGGSRRLSGFRSRMSSVALLTLALIAVR